MSSLVPVVASVQRPRTTSTLSLQRPISVQDYRKDCSLTNATMSEEALKKKIVCGTDVGNTVTKVHRTLYNGEDALLGSFRLHLFGSWDSIPMAVAV